MIRIVKAAEAASTAAANRSCCLMQLFQPTTAARILAAATTTTTIPRHNNNNNNLTNKTFTASISSASLSSCNIVSPTNSQQQQQHFPLNYIISSSNQCHRFFHSTSFVQMPSSSIIDNNTHDEDEEEIVPPPNLKFDRKSSFAPKEKPLLVVPPDAINPSSMMIDHHHQDTGSELDGGNGGADDDYIMEDIDDDYIDDEDVDDLIDSTSTTTTTTTSTTARSRRTVIPLPDRLHATIYHGPDGSKAGTIWLDESVFGVDPIRIDLMKQSVDYIRNKIRGRRKAKSKTIAEVSGSGRKVRKQKGTGQARAGHSRPAHWRGGAKAHGPKNTVDYGNIKMNKHVKTLAMRSTLSQKVKEGNLILVDHLQLPTHKTKDWAQTLQEAYGIGKYDGGSSAFILDHYLEPDNDDGDDENNNVDFHASYHGVPINLWVASSNIYKIKVANQRFANVYDILKKEKLVITLSALQEMEKRWKDA